MYCDLQIALVEFRQNHNLIQIHIYHKTSSCAWLRPIFDTKQFILSLRSYYLRTNAGSGKFYSLSISLPPIFMYKCIHNCALHEGSTGDRNKRMVEICLRFG